MSIDAFFNLNLIFQRMTYSLDVLHQGGVLICFNSSGDQVENDCLQRAISYFKDLPFDMGICFDMFRLLFYNLQATLHILDQVSTMLV